jgi:hypothetical protein
MPVIPEEKKRLVEWMDAATGAGAELEIPHGTLNVTRFADAFWYLSHGIDWSPGPGQNLPSVSVPTGFVTDFAASRAGCGRLSPATAITFGPLSSMTTSIGTRRRRRI